MNRQVLVVDDDVVLARVLLDSLIFEGFDVEYAANGHQAIAALRNRAPDLIVLDVMLPDWNGFDLCRTLRQEGRTPVIFLTALSSKIEKLRGLNLGADDYVTKPFDLEEFLARVHAVFRRTRPDVGCLVLGNVVVDFRTHTATRHGRSLHLTHREFELLKYFAERPERIVDRNELLRSVWGYPDLPITRSVDHAVARLRRKLEPRADRPQCISHRSRRRLRPDTNWVSPVSSRVYLDMNHRSAGLSPLFGTAQ